MKITETRSAEVVVEVICDGCGQTTTKDRENGIHEYARLSANWGYDSNHDNERYDYQLCETCFFKVLVYLQEQRRPLDILKGSVFLFDHPTDPVWSEEDEPLGGQGVGQSGRSLAITNYDNLLSSGYRVQQTSQPFPCFAHANHSHVTLRASTYGSCTQCQPWISHYISSTFFSN